MLFIIVVDVIFFKQKTAYEMRISDWSSDVCSSDLVVRQIEYTVPFLDVESRDRDQRVSFRLPFDPRLELSSGLRLKGVAVTISASDWQETFRIAEERREAGADFPDDARTDGGGVVLFPRREIGRAHV